MINGQLLFVVLTAFNYSLLWREAEISVMRSER